ncbi:hypothetical protein ETD83_32805, partial [Actinomadura soli]
MALVEESARPRRVPADQVEQGLGGGVLSRRFGLGGTAERGFRGAAERGFRGAAERGFGGTAERGF